MKLVIYAGDDVRPIGLRIGTAEYSYHFVIAAFLPVLSRIADIRIVAHLDDVEPIRADCELRGEAITVLSFVPPHKTTLFMRVPLVPVFAWEFESIPTEIWDGQPKHDWRMVLSQAGRAITLSTHSAQVIRNTMGEGFPAVGVPPPVFERMAALRARIGGLAPRARTLDFHGALIDTHTLPIAWDMPIPARPWEDGPEADEEVAGDDGVGDVAGDDSGGDDVAGDGEPAVADALGAADAGAHSPEPAPEPEPEPEPERHVPRGTAGRILGFYRDRVRPAAPAPVVAAASTLGRVAWHASQLLLPMPETDRPTIAARARVVAHHGAIVYREAVRDVLPRGTRRIIGTGGAFGGRAWRVGLRVARAAAAAARDSNEEAEPGAAPIAGHAPESAAPDIHAPERGQHGSRPMPVFEMPPPLDSLPIPLPLAESFVLKHAAEAQAEARKPAQRVLLDGVVFLAVLNPSDGRKNWPEMLSGFIWGLGHRPDATLVLKFSCPTLEEYWDPFFIEMLKQPHFVARIVVIHGFLDDAQMGILLESARYIVNVSSCEGCALPLLEGMSVGRPAIAPDHTAMGDYIDPSNAFVIETHLEQCVFPQDGRATPRTMWHCPRWDSLVARFAEAYDVAVNDPVRWHAMADAAMSAQAAFCGDAVVEQRLRDLLGLQRAPFPLTSWGRDLSSIPLATSDVAEVVAS